MNKYQTGIQKSVLAIIKRSKEMDLKYITKSQIVEQLKKIRPDIINIDRKVAQALYQLQRKTKYRRQRIQKYHDRAGHRKGWVPFVEKEDTEKDKKQN